MPAPDGAAALEELAAELDEAAGRLRAGNLEQAEAAALVERCAELAGRVGAQLEREARGVHGGEGQPGQEQLL